MLYRSIVFLFALSLPVVGCSASNVDPAPASATDELRTDNGDARFVWLAQTTPMELEEAAKKKFEEDFAASEVDAAGNVTASGSEGLVQNMLEDEKVESMPGTEVRERFPKWVRRAITSSLSTVGTVDREVLRARGYWAFGRLAHFLDVRSSVKFAERVGSFDASDFPALFERQDCAVMDPIVKILNRQGLSLRQITHSPHSIFERGEDAIRAYARSLNEHDQREFRERVIPAIRRGDIKNAWYLLDDDDLDNRVLILIDKKEQLYVLKGWDC